MLVAKIMKNAKSFSGVTYNEKRRKEGEAELIHAANFLGEVYDGNNGKGYIEFLNMWSNKNERIKKPQLHVVISSKGKASTKEELLEAAKEWMKQMGYGENPYLVYFHKNTVNNHIHIVSSRVNKDGEKINDSFEKDRSLKVIDAISKVNRAEELRQLVADSLRYSYGNQKQFELILEKRGCVVKSNGNNGILTIYKAGEKLDVKKELIDFCQKRYSKEYEKSSLKKMREIIKKYSKAMNRDDFSSYMRLKFGCDFVFFGKTDNPYGYAIIDNRKRMVIAGKSIVPVKELLANFSVALDRKVYFENKIKQICKSKPKITIKGINRILAKDGVVIEDGQIKDLMNKDKALGGIDDRLVQLMNENNKKYFLLNKYKPANQTEINWINKEYKTNLSIEDIKDIRINDKDVDYYREWMEYLLESGNIRHEMQKEGLRVYLTDNDFVLIDERNKTITSGQELEIDRELFLDRLMTNTEDYENEENMTERIQDHVSGLLNGIIDGLGSLLPNAGGYGSGSDLAKKKKKKKKQL